jgi:crotonobetainyl-CoA:carnitine CoA-transferase CaiB-like acyl-CoA transferase
MPQEGGNVYDVLEGIQVVEAASFLLVPTAGGVLADWGADVVKIEHPVTGDPYRGLRNDLVQPGVPNPMLQLPNRGKRSLGLDLTTPEGLEVLYDLIRRADVFLTSFMRPTLEKLKIDWESLKEINPRLIYGRASGYGPLGPEADTPGFDLAATWARAGFLYEMTATESTAPVLQPGSVGDLSGGLNLASGVAAALFKRERTGEGLQVDVSLYHSGMWIMAQSIGAASVGLAKLPFHTNRESPRNPLVNSYLTRDNRWIILCMIQPDKYWDDFCNHIGHPALAQDPRFCEFFVREEHTRELVIVLDEIFGARDFEDWREQLSTMEGVWAPALSPQEVAVDPQVLENGYFPELEATNGAKFRSVASPIQYEGKDIGSLQAMPEHGQHTEEILLELGMSWDDLGRLKDSNIIN